MNQRRTLLKAASVLGFAGLGGGALMHSRSLQAADYKALVVIDLSGGNDGHNLLIPTDGAFLDYERARTALALPKDSLRRLDKASAGHALSMHPATPKLASLYNRERLGFIAGVGALVEPSTPEQVISKSVRLPLGLFSHSDQRSFVQGSSVDASGWAGRGLERLNAGLRHRTAAVSMTQNRTLVQGQTSPVSMMGNGGNPWWGNTHILENERKATQAIARMTNWQFVNDYERVYAQSLQNSFQDSILFAKADEAMQDPVEDFGDSGIGRDVRFLAKALPYMKAVGKRRQVFFLEHWGFDTHTDQRGTGERTQDTRLSVLDHALSAFDQSMVRAGMGDDVLVLVMSEFGRTLSHGSGGGSEHAWDNYWMLLGGYARGGEVVGRIPSLVLGGPDDSDPNKNGRFVPTISADQVGASLMQWLGLDTSQFTTVFPNLVNFKTKTVDILRS